MLTADGSHSVRDKQTGATYHSVHGAIRESEHVYVNALRHLAQTQPSVSILEMGFGTGLNALLSCLAVEGRDVQVHYTTIERFPLEAAIIHTLNYCTMLGRPERQALFQQLHACDWGSDQTIARDFTIHKIAAGIEDASTAGVAVDIVYYDAFAPEVQAELWSRAIFEKISACMKKGGMLTTYCSKSVVRRAMQAAGLRVEKRPGPPGKREIVYAFRDQ